jgi:hypothetical protein
MENVVQAIARDVFTTAMPALERAGCLFSAIFPPWTMRDWICGFRCHSASLARQSGLSCSDIARLAIRHTLVHPAEIIAALRPAVSEGGQSHEL